MDNKQIQLTKTGFEALKKEYEELLNTKRPKMVDRLSNARAQGDLKENSDYQNAKEALGFMDGKIEELKKVIENASVIENESNGSVGVGTKVTVKINEKTQVFEIVGDFEADPINKKISHTSPLGTALVGKAKGDKVEVDAPAGKISYEIVDIS